MKSLLVILSISGMFLIAQKTQARTGEEVYNTNCLGCHSPAAVGMSAPMLNGLSAEYITNELMNFKLDKRKDNMMMFMNAAAKGLSDDEIISVGAYVEKLSECDFPNTIVNPGNGNVKAGELLVSQNACFGCHVTGNPYKAPKIAGQKAQYIYLQLKEFQKKNRTGTFMNELAKNFTDQQMLDMAAFINSKRSCSN